MQVDGSVSYQIAEVKSHQGRLPWSTEASECESRAQWRPAQAAPSAKVLLTRSFLPLTTSGRGETAAQEPQGERPLSSVYFDEEETGEILPPPWPPSPRATPGRGGEAAAREPRRERPLSSVYFDEEETGEIRPPPEAQEPRRERTTSLLCPSLILGDKAKPSHVASKGKGKEDSVEKRRCPRNKEIVGIVDGSACYEVADIKSHKTTRFWIWMCGELEGVARYPRFRAASSRHFTWKSTTDILNGRA